MKKVFEIEWCDDYGDEWLNKENLEACLFSNTHMNNVQVEITDITCQCCISTYSRWDSEKGRHIERCVACEKVVE